MWNKHREGTGIVITWPCSGQLWPWQCELRGHAREVSAECWLRAVFSNLWGQKPAFRNLIGMTSWGLNFIHGWKNNPGQEGSCCVFWGFFLEQGCQEMKRHPSPHGRMSWVGVSRGLPWVAAGRHRSPKHPLSGEAQVTIQMFKESGRQILTVLFYLCLFCGTEVGAD